MFPKKLAVHPELHIGFDVSEFLKRRQSLAFFMRCREQVDSSTVIHSAGSPG
jgi:hypothetical protein